MENNNFIGLDDNQLEQFVNNSKNKQFKKDGNIYTFFKEKEEINKYFVSLKNKNEEYIGVLSKNFKRHLFGYSLFNQGDEYLGEILNEKKHGFGIYKFKIKEKEYPDIYIGDFSDNKINGEGIYISILKGNIIPKGKLNAFQLIKYNCYLGQFKNGEFKNGKIYNFSEDFECLKIENENNNSFSIEKRNDIILVNKAIIKNDKIYEGILISINKDKIEDKLFYSTNDNSNFNFTTLNDEDSKVKEIFNDFRQD